MAAPLSLPRQYTPVHEYVFKLQRLLATLHTPTARALGAERRATIAAFSPNLAPEMMAATPRHLAK